VIRVRSAASGWPPKLRGRAARRRDRGGPCGVRGEHPPSRAQARRDGRADGIALEAYRYATLPTWRIIGLDDTLFVSTFDADREGHESPVYRIDVAAGGALYCGFRRMLVEMTATAERFI
jgi:hypothetical protein